LDSAGEKLRAINPHLTIRPFATRLASANALEIVREFDLVVDGTDNFPTRYLVNDACVLTRKPNVYGSVYRFEGQVSVFGAPGGPCYRCLYPEPPPPGEVPSCAEGGVLGILPGLVGLMQATEAVKLLLGIGEPLVGRLVLVDALGMRFRELAIRRDPRCPACGDHPSLKGLIDYDAFCGVVSDDARSAASGSTITAPELKAMIDSGTVFQLIDVREPVEWEIVRIPGATLIPKDRILSGEALSELLQDRPIVLHCKSGVRSAEALAAVKKAGFADATHLQGGVLAWAKQVDPSLPTY
ncbi:MAG: ThiF family adenylyltransferase, partial [Mycobacteriaceae bacterium]